MRWVSVEFQLTFNCWISVELQLHNAGWSVTGEFQLAFNCVEFQFSFNYVCNWISYWWILTRIQLLNFSWVSTMCASGSVTLLVNFNLLSTVEFQLAFNYVCKWMSWKIHMQMSWVSTGEFQLAFNCWTSVEFQLYKQVDQLKNSHANELSFNWWISTRIQLLNLSWISTSNHFL